jgi:hypothetical protein
VGVTEPPGVTVGVVVAGVSVGVGVVVPGVAGEVDVGVGVPAAEVGVGVSSGGGNSWQVVWSLPYTNWMSLISMSESGIDGSRSKRT